MPRSFRIKGPIWCGSRASNRWDVVSAPPYFSIWAADQKRGADLARRLTAPVIIHYIWLDTVYSCVWTSALGSCWVTCLGVFCSSSFSSKCFIAWINCTQICILLLWACLCVGHAHQSISISTVSLHRASLSCRYKGKKMITMTINSL